MSYVVISSKMQSSFIKVLLLLLLPQVGCSTISVSLSGGAGSGMGHFPLLRLQERGPDSEYVLLLPPSVAEVLLEVLQRALDCVQTGNNGYVQLSAYELIGMHACIT